MADPEVERAWEGCGRNHDMMSARDGGTDLVGGIQLAKSAEGQLQERKPRKRGGGKNKKRNWELRRKSEGIQDLGLDTENTARPINTEDQNEFLADYDVKPGDTDFIPRVFDVAPDEEKARLSTSSPSSRSIKQSLLPVKEEKRKRNRNRNGMVKDVLNNTASILARAMGDDSDKVGEILQQATEQIRLVAKVLLDDIENAGVNEEELYNAPPRKKTKCEVRRERRKSRVTERSQPRSRRLEKKHKPSEQTLSKIPADVLSAAAAARKAVELAAKGPVAQLIIEQSKPENRIRERLKKRNHNRLKEDITNPMTLKGTEPHIEAYGLSNRMIVDTVGQETKDENQAHESHSTPHIPIAADIPVLVPKVRRTRSRKSKSSRNVQDKKIVYQKDEASKSDASEQANVPKTHDVHTLSTEKDISPDISHDPADETIVDEQDKVGGVEMTSRIPDPLASGAAKDKKSRRGRKNQQAKERAAERWVETQAKNQKIVPDSQDGSIVDENYEGAGTEVDQLADTLMEDVDVPAPMPVEQPTKDTPISSLFAIDLEPSKIETIENSAVLSELPNTNQVKEAQGGRQNRARKAMANLENEDNNDSEESKELKIEGSETRKYDEGVSIAVKEQLEAARQWQPQPQVIIYTSSEPTDPSGEVNDTSLQSTAVDPDQASPVTASAKKRRRILGAVANPSPKTQLGHNGTFASPEQIPTAKQSHRSKAKKRRLAIVERELGITLSDNHDCLSEDDHISTRQHRSSSVAAAIQGTSDQMTFTDRPSDIEDMILNKFAHDHSSTPEDLNRPQLGSPPSSTKEDSFVDLPVLRSTPLRSKDRHQKGGLLKTLSPSVSPSAIKSNESRDECGQFLNAIANGTIDLTRLADKHQHRVNNHKARTSEDSTLSMLFIGSSQHALRNPGPLTEQGVLTTTQRDILPLSRNTDFSKPLLDSPTSGKTFTPQIQKVRRNKAEYFFDKTERLIRCLDPAYNTLDLATPNTTIRHDLTLSNLDYDEPPSAQLLDDAFVETSDPCTEGFVSSPALGSDQTSNQQIQNFLSRSLGQSGDSSINNTVKKERAKRPPTKSPFFKPPPTTPMNKKSKILSTNENDNNLEHSATPRLTMPQNAHSRPSESPKKSSPAGIISCIPFPKLPLPLFGLIQEKLAHDPFQLLIAVTLLNRTRGKLAIPTFFELVQKYPTPKCLALADREDIVSTIRHLGLHNQRAATIQTYSHQWLTDPPMKGKRFAVKGYPEANSGRDIKDEIITDDDPREGWEIGHMTQGPYALDSWRIFCRDELRGLATDWNGEDSKEECFQPEWMRVLPEDKELRAYLRWMWLKEGFEWDPFTGEKEVASKKLLTAAKNGKIAWDDTGGMRILDDDEQQAKEASPINLPLESKQKTADRPVKNPDGGEKGDLEMPSPSCKRSKVGLAVENGEVSEGVDVNDEDIAAIAILKNAIRKMRSKKS
ncbi:hypothetical protein BJ875DRAFT_482243 [Amylocarpus encephaloides]|uniref:HhH-GPD domain-containing protein n=1 Tax=Amylocarpus encephaloides TaxID=45428 RepID=A0A9P8C8W0_9HELO|nr:hypothetical protein BJ875DRAFT_482243 [Amylocarpus encephaloides]